MSTAVNTMTAADVLTYVKRAFGDESGVQITDADIFRWLNIAQSDVAHQTKCIQGKATTPTVVGQYQYTLPTADAIEIVAIQLDGRPLTGMEFSYVQQALADEDPTWTQSGTPMWWTKWANEISIYPKPTAVGTLTVFYIGTPAKVTLGSDVLGIEDRYYPALLLYVMAQAYELDEDFQARDSAYSQYQQKIGDSFGEETIAQNLFYPVITEVD